MSIQTKNQPGGLDIDTQPCVKTLTHLFRAHAFDIRELIAIARRVQSDPKALQSHTRRQAEANSQSFRREDAAIPTRRRCYTGASSL